MALLTVADLEAALADERHLGFGYATIDQAADYVDRWVVDAVVVDVANDLGLGPEALFAWANSKHARWLVDELAGHRGPARPVVERHLNPRAVAEALEV